MLLPLRTTLSSSAKKVCVSCYRVTLITGVSTSETWRQGNEVHNYTTLRFFADYRISILNIFKIYSNTRFSNLSTPPCLESLDFTQNFSHQILFLRVVVVETYSIDNAPLWTSTFPGKLHAVRRDCLFQLCAIRIL